MPETSVSTKNFGELGLPDFWPSATVAFLRPPDFRAKAGDTPQGVSYRMQPVFAFPRFSPVFSSSLPSRPDL